MKRSVGNFEDGMVVVTSGGERYQVFLPRWWELHRWLRWWFDKRQPKAVITITGSSGGEPMIVQLRITAA
jgi:hypothetical protein